jgi:hypothetical protein
MSIKINIFDLNFKLHQLLLSNFCLYILKQDEILILFRIEIYV